jgi:hypothetical protein
MGDEDYTEVELPDGATVRISNNIFQNNITTNRRNYWDYYEQGSYFNMEEFEVRPEPRTIRVNWTRQTLDDLEDWFYFDTDEYLLGGRPDDTIKRKAEKYRRNSRKYRTIRI